MKYCSVMKVAKADFTCPVTGMEFVFVKGGTFDMGDTFGDGFGDGKPVHKVTINDFYIAKYPTTQVEWMKIMEKNPSRFKGDRNPVENVSWDDVQEFIKGLNGATGTQYRLPTEAEWEYAARSGGKKEKWAGISNEAKLDNYAWYYANSGSKTHPVGQKLPNELGLYDMSGNVSEWCSDWYRNYPTTHQNNPTGPTNGSNRVYRGGSWKSRPVSLLTSYRNSNSHCNRYSSVGFRLAFTV